MYIAKFARSLIPILLTLVWIGCSDDDGDVVKPTTGTVVFKVSSANTTYEVYLDQGLAGTVSSVKELTIGNVAPGDHVYYFKDTKTQCVSTSSSFAAKAGVTDEIIVGSGRLQLEWASCPETAIKFILGQSGSTYKVYLDGSLVATLTSSVQDSVVETSPGSHTYYVTVTSCSGLQSKPKSVSVEEYSTVDVSLSSGSLTFDTKAPVSISASSGIYTDYVSVAWNDPNSPNAPKYEIYRAKGSGSYGYHTSVSGVSYRDYNAAKGSQYNYKVRAVWSCQKSNWSSSANGYRKAALFSNTRVVNNNSLRRTYIHTDIQIDGYKGQSLRLGGYWLRKVGVSYYYQYSDCSHNTPGGWLGTLWNSCLTPAYDRTKYTNQWFWISYDCFKEYSGCYYGRIKLYKTCSVGNVNDPIIAATSLSDYVRICWSKAAPGSEPEVHVELLSPEEAREFENSQQSATFEIVPGDGVFNLNPAATGTGADNNLTDNAEDSSF